MDQIKALFGGLNGWVGAHLAEGTLRSLVCDGVIAGVGGVLVFIPQICILFLFIAILEDCGYMSRAAFLMDRLFSKLGLSGKSFIPMLSSFACAVPGIMATRTIENPRDRLTTILISPLMSCSARLPVYIILIKTFIPDGAEHQYLGGYLTLQGLTFFAMYWVGILVAIPMAWLLKKTLLRGETPPFLIELPSYKIPDWKTVLMRVYSSGKAFTMRAGTVILAVSIVVWALAYFPRPDSIAKEFETRRVALETQAETDLSALGVTETIDVLKGEALANNKSELAQLANKSTALKDQLEEMEKKFKAGNLEKSAYLTAVAQAVAEQKQFEADPLWEKAVAVLKLNADLEDLDNEENGAYLRESYFGRMGRSVEPIFKPLGWDWRISMAAIASFPAREVIVATLGTIFNLGNETDAESDTLREALKNATWDDDKSAVSGAKIGRKLFNIPVALSVMVFFALCSQCAATLATIRRETNSWRWPIFSFVYMTTLAYVAALITYQTAAHFLL
jgi:ferrous iron transport protein B